MALWKIAAVQMDVRIGEKAHNLARIRERLEECRRAGARLVIFPECALPGYAFTSREEARTHAELVPGPVTQRLAEDCRRLNVWAVVGMLETTSDGRLFNAAALIGPIGEPVTYRKIHLPCLGVDRFVTPGDRPFAVHDLGGLRLGLTICYDGSFPEAARVLTLHGADLVALPTNWPDAALCAAEYLVPARALENGIYYAGVNRCGTERGYHFIGASRIANVNGDLLAVSSHDGEDVLYAELDPERARCKRVVTIPGEYEVDRVGDRRPEMYRPLIADKE